MIAVFFTFSLDAFFATTILGALNEMKVRQMAPGQQHLIFKAALIVFCFRLLVCAEGRHVYKLCKYFSFPAVLQKRN